MSPTPSVIPLVKRTDGEVEGAGELAAAQSRVREGGGAAGEQGGAGVTMVTM